MNAIESLSCRMAFNGLPVGEVQRILRRCEDGHTWLRTCLRSASGMRRLARQCQSEHRWGSARDAWFLTAAACQAASYCIHFSPDNFSIRHVQHARRLARSAYLQALQLDRTAGEAVAIPFDGRSIHGYLRRPPATRPAPVIVLLNGLDSICEVEMHVFSTWLHSRGFITLALDLPADASSPIRRPLLEVERAAGPIAAFIRGVPGARQGRHGVFGVSFGGYLSARLLASGAPFHCAVAVSPPAWLRPAEMPARIRSMLAWTCDVKSQAALDDLTAHTDLQALPAPAGRLLLFQMQNDSIFDERHARAVVEWGGAQVELRSVVAEHVGTSAFHQWLPWACDWLQAQLQEEVSCTN